MDSHVLHSLSMATPKNNRDAKLLETTFLRIIGTVAALLMVASGLRLCS